ncbi:hypothetical protein IVA78_26590 [Bradyrhizobium sp. 137]|uniref:hypothetical protein n=1 Tax=Bradyrhizobium sp. 137 TaxID=2782614 RepID=UPI001FFAA4DF|nr:hypothetical protein [Bradyrhizobium sp. 137]MCK1758645.1 hypothetical protein [Bradyrhizobium sp. 137]
MPNDHSDGKSQIFTDEHRSAWIFPLVAKEFADFMRFLPLLLRRSCPAALLGSRFMVEACKPLRPHFNMLATTDVKGIA